MGLWLQQLKGGADAEAEAEAVDMLWQDLILVDIGIMSTIVCSSCLQYYMVIKMPSTWIEVDT